VSMSEQQKTQPQFMTRKEVAGLMRVTERTVTRWIALGRLRVVRIGGTLRFDRRSVIRSIERHEYGDDRKPHDPAMG